MKRKIVWASIINWRYSWNLARPAVAAVGYPGYHAPVVAKAVAPVGGLLGNCFVLLFFLEKKPSESS